ncbi:MAG: glycogen/starch/alpha-glucan phosphorylase [Anaerolineae bacterium]|uniref:glycogen/starch/alpha-glucan phosphorylase n=1 Tax=Promineifilum sp. TaxID=2664178 RepID=UPI002411A3B4|nr:glycogen/starch/alpha-glucan phosphorylase [Promineifilum sp.]MCW5848153.1 glycogen/starch/alpha-glucan phosphorylase [Anaerolineae bacterium]
MEIQQPTTERTDRTPEAFRQYMVDNLYYARGANVQSASDYDMYMALSRTVRNHLVERFRRTVDMRYAVNPRFVYYLSAEYLLGRQLPQNLLYTQTDEIAEAALRGSPHPLEEVLLHDVEPGLGNGGLGRLAACFLDSLATLDIPAIGYGIRYEYGIFRQEIRDGYQVEQPDDWLALDYPWEFAQPDDMIPVGFGGHAEHYEDEHGHVRARWQPAEQVMGEPHHILVPGYQTTTVNFLRLWRARATTEFDFRLFDIGDYASAVEHKVRSETISKVLYPNDNTPQGRELRLRQQYFFVACSLHDIIARFLRCGNPIDDLARKVVIQLNDTHPVVAIPELMRLLIDEYDLQWHEAWEITRHTFAYTCHTLMPEALERWPVSLFERLLPRHMEIVNEINRRFLGDISAKYPNDYDRLSRMSLIQDGGDRQVRMAHLAVVGSFSVNGVADLHSQLLKERVFHDFYELWPEKFNNKTNGVTPRRFMRIANPSLSALLTERLGEGWLTDLERLSKLENHIEDPAFRAAWQEVKAANKVRLAAHILARTGVVVDPNSMYDVMVKRLHEYKRQLLKALHIVTLYNRLKEDPTLDLVPRTFVFGAKAAPGYYMAKLIIKLITSIGAVVNEDAGAGKLLKVVFLPNFNVTQGQIIYPAADLSEQISLAGKEASGTGNMKFALNGALTIGTLDGANVEIRERVGADNFFLFGLTVEEVFALKSKGYDPRAVIEGDPELKQVIDQISAGVFSDGDPTLFEPIIRSLLDRDEFLVLADYRAYVDAQDEVEKGYRDVDTWTRKSILNAARCGFFSSDRAMRQYAADIWKVEPLPVR